MGAQPLKDNEVAPAARDDLHDIESLAVSSSAGKPLHMRWITLEFLDNEMERAYVARRGDDAVLGYVKTKDSRARVAIVIIGATLCAAGETYAGVIILLASLVWGVSFIPIYTALKKRTIYWIAARVIYLAGVMSAHTAAVVLAEDQSMKVVATAFLIDWFVVLMSQAEVRAIYYPALISWATLCYAVLIVFLPPDVSIAVKALLGLFFVSRSFLGVMAGSREVERRDRYEFQRTIGLEVSRQREMRRALRAERQNAVLKTSLRKAQEIVDRVVEEGGSLLDQWSLQSADIELGESIGEGSFGTVHRGTMRRKRQGVEEHFEVAIKTVRTTKVTKASVRSFMKEILIMAPLKHENLVTLMGGVWSEGPDKLRLVLEYCHGGSLRDLFNDKERFIVHSWKTIYLPIIVGVAMGMRYLHHEAPGDALIHRDLKPENTFLSAKLQAKIGDFGESRRFDSEQSSECEGNAAVLLMTRIGTPLYTAPEIIYNMPYNSKVDVYSFGILLLETICVCHGCDADFIRRQFRACPGLAAVKSGWRPKVPMELPKKQPELYELARECHDADPELRPTFLDAVALLNGITSEADITAVRKMLSTSF